MSRLRSQPLHVNVSYDTLHDVARQTYFPHLCTQREDSKTPLFGAWAHGTGPSHVIALSGCLLEARAKALFYHNLQAQ